VADLLNHPLAIFVTTPNLFVLGLTMNAKVVENLQNCGSLGSCRLGMEGATDRLKSSAQKTPEIGERWVPPVWDGAMADL